MNKPLLEEADKLFDIEEYEKVYDLLLPHKNKEDDEILWRLAIAIQCLNYYKPNQSSPSIKRMYEEALQLATKALKINDKNPQVHKTLFGVMDSHYKNVSIKARVQQSVVAKNHIMTALELNPKDPETWWAVGQWYYAIADAPWVLKKIVLIVFSTPLEGTYEDAFTYFQKVLVAENQKKCKLYCDALLMAGKCCIKLNKYAEGIQYLKKVLDCPEKMPTEKRAHEEARKLLKKMGI